MIPLGCVLAVLGFLARVQAVIGGVTVPALWLAAAAVVLACLAVLMLAAGLRVGVGSDSVASVSPMNLLAEAREARVIGRLDAETTLRLVTLDAARAIELERDVGSLVPGKWGDLVAIDLPGPVDAGLVTGTVLSRPLGAIALTLLGGREVYRRGAH